MEKTIRILIVDDHPTMRFGLVGLFKQTPDFLVVGEASDGEEAVEIAGKIDVDVIIMDFALPKKSGLEAIQEILAIHPNIKILIFTAFSNGDQILAGIKAGAIGYVVKDSSPNELVTAVRNAFHGKPSLTHEIELNLMHQIQQNPIIDFPVDKLTDREIEILSWLAQGLTNAQMAEKGFISEGTVRSHISNLLSKLRLENRAQAVIYALRKGVIDIKDS
jgi:NarL family two-component system response regulator LiaR